MNELDLTHITSLDSEKVNIPGLDIDAALDKTIAMGDKKVRARKIKTFTSFSSAAVVVLIAIGSFVFLINETTGSNSSKITNATNRKVETQVKGTVVEENLEQNVTSAPVTSQPQKPEAVVPKLITFLSYGDASLCNVQANPNVDNGGVVVGPSSTVETWRPRIGDSRIQTVPTSGRQLNIKNVANNNATNGVYASLVSGFDRSSSYANVSTFSLTYCESGYALNIKPTNIKGEYSVSTTSL